jgi:hypothetical protein
MELLAMARLVWAVLCSRIIVDQATQNVSLIETIEEIQISPTPPVGQPAIVPIQMDLAALVVRSQSSVPESTSLKTIFLDPNGTKISDNQIQLDLNEFARCRAFVRINALSISMLGTHHIDVQLGDPSTNHWTSFADIPLEIH